MPGRVTVTILKTQGVDRNSHGVDCKRSQQCHTVVYLRIGKLFVGFLDESAIASAGLFFLVGAGAGEKRKCQNGACEDEFFHVQTVYRLWFQSVNLLISCRNGNNNVSRVQSGFLKFAIQETNKHIIRK